MILSRIHVVPMLLAAAFACVPSTAFAITGRAIFLGGGADAPRSAFLVAGGEAIEIELPRRNLSAEFEFPGSSLTLAMLPAPPAPGVEIDPASPVVRIPENCSRCLLLVVPDTKNKVFPVRVMVIDASVGKFPAGRSILYNLTRAQVAGKFSEQVVKVAGYRNAVVDAPRSDAGGYPVLISYRPSKAEEWTVLCSSTWLHNPKARQLIFVVPEEGRIPRVWTVVDHPQVGRDDSEE